MERADIEVDVISIDYGKAIYIASKGVDIADVYEVHGNQPRYFVKSAPRGLFDMIGPDRRGRFLIAGIMNVTGNDWRLITAYWNDDGRAKRIYEG